MVEITRVGGQLKYKDTSTGRIETYPIDDVRFTPVTELGIEKIEMRINETPFEITIYSDISVPASSDPEDLIDQLGVLIDYSTGGGGESNTASNVGTGVGSFKQKVGVDLEFRSFEGIGAATVIQNGDQVRIDVPSGVSSQVNADNGTILMDGNVTAQSLTALTPVKVANWTSNVSNQNTTPDFTTGRITADVSGLYTVSFTAFGVYPVNNETILFIVYVNGSPVLVGNSDGVSNSNGNRFNVSEALTISLAATEYIELWVVGSATANVTIEDSVMQVVRQASSATPFREPTYTGVDNGGGRIVSLNATQVTITAGSGVEVDAYTDTTNVTNTEFSWPEITPITITMATDVGCSYLLIDPSNPSVIVQQATPPTPSQRKTLVPVGAVDFAQGSITGIINTPRVINQISNFVHNMVNFVPTSSITNGFSVQPVTGVLSVFRQEGEVLFPNINWDVDKTDNDVSQVPAVGDSSTALAFSTIDSNDLVISTGVTLIPKIWDNAGTPTALTGNDAVIHYLYGDIHGNHYLQYGQVSYTNIDVAFENLELDRNAFTPFNGSLALTLLAQIALSTAAVDFDDTSESGINNLLDAGGGLSAAVNTNVANSNLLADAIRHLNMAGFGLSITNNGSAPDASALLDLQSTTRGFGFPTMNTAQRLAIATPKAGLSVYDTDLGRLFTYDAGQGGWKIDGVVEIYNNNSGGALVEGDCVLYSQSVFNSAVTSTTIYSSLAFGAVVDGGANSTNITVASTGSWLIRFDGSFAVSIGQSVFNSNTVKNAIATSAGSGQFGVALQAKGTGADTLLLASLGHSL